MATCSFVLDKYIINHLKRLSKKLSVECGKHIPMSELVRDALENDLGLKKSSLEDFINEHKQFKCGKKAEEKTIKKEVEQAMGKKRRSTKKEEEPLKFLKPTSPIEKSIRAHLKTLFNEDPKAEKFFNFPVPSFVRKGLLDLCSKQGCSSHKEVLFVFLVYHILLRNLNMRWYYEESKITSKAHKVYEEDGFLKVDIGHKHIRRLCGSKFSPIGTQAVNLVAMDKHDYYKKECRKYYFKLEIFEELISLVAQNVSKRLTKKSKVAFVDLYTGRISNSEFFLKEEKGIKVIVPNSWYELQDKVTRVPLSSQTMSSILKDLISDLSAKSVSDNPLRILRSFSSILAKSKFEGDSVMYKPEYKMGTTGRSYEIGGGFQGLPKEYKQRLTQDFECYNYDFKSMHMYNLYMLCSNLKLSKHWHIRYIQGKFSKVFDDIGLKLSDLKPVCYSVSMGARLNTKLYKKDESAAAKILNALSPTPKQYKEFYATVKPLAESFKKISEKFLLGYKTIKVKDRNHFINDFGVVIWNICVKDKVLYRFVDHTWEKVGKREQNKIMRFLVSFMTQGSEQALVLQVASHFSEFRMFSNEHDGFVCNMPISERNTRLACNKVFEFPLMLSPKLVIKPFAETQH